MKPSEFNVLVVEYVCKVDLGLLKDYQFQLQKDMDLLILEKRGKACEEERK